jgi:hypothetical protein
MRRGGEGEEPVEADDADGSQPSEGGRCGRRWADAVGDPGRWKTHVLAGLEALLEDLLNALKGLLLLRLRTLVQHVRGHRRLKPWPKNTPPPARQRQLRVVRTVSEAAHCAQPPVWHVVAAVEVACGESAVCSNSDPRPTLPFYPVPPPPASTLARRPRGAFPRLQQSMITAPDAVPPPRITRWRSRGELPYHARIDASRGGESADAPSGHHRGCSGWASCGCSSPA